MKENSLGIQSGHFKQTLTKTKTTYKVVARVRETKKAGSSAAGLVTMGSYCRGDEVVSRMWRKSHWGVSS